MSILDSPSTLTTKGRYLPVFASAVYDGNAALVKAGRKPINLQSVMIGNGITDNCQSRFPLRDSS
jgi:carboxypeptidase C (cathepsin A)